MINLFKRTTIVKTSIIWLILSSGAVFYSKLNMFLCMAIMMTLGAVLVVIFNRSQINKSNFIKAVLVSLFGILTCVANNMHGFSINDLLIFIGELIFLAAICSAITFCEFKKIYINAICIIAVISIVCFAFVFLFPNVSLPFEMRSVDVNWTGTFYYTLGFYEGRTFRNAGVFGEGGVFQIFLNLALFYLVQSREQIEHRKFKMFVLIIAILTTVSSMGYIVLILVIISMLAKKGSLNIRTLFLCLACVVLIVIVDISTGLISEKIINQGGSFGSRYDDTVVSILTANEKPILGYGIANDFSDAWNSHLNSLLRITDPAYVDLQRSSGFGLILVRCGYPFAVFYLASMYLYFKRSSESNILINLIGALILILGVFNEPIQFTPIYLLSLFTWKKSKEGEASRCKNYV